MGKALEAEYREGLQQRADQAIYARRAAAVEQERRIKENELNTQVLLEQRPARPVIGVAAGEAKIAAVKGALHGHLINGLISDEATAERLLASTLMPSCRNNIIKSV